MAGFITETHLPLIREIYGDYVAKRCQDAPVTSTFLAVLTQAQEEERTIRANIETYLDTISAAKARI